MNPHQSKLEPSGTCHNEQCHVVGSEIQNQPSTKNFNGQKLGKKVNLRKNNFIHFAVKFDVNKTNIHLIYEYVPFFHFTICPFSRLETLTPNSQNACGLYIYIIVK